MDADATVEGPDRDETLALLAKRRRRATLEYLAANGGSATTGELARHVSDGEEEPRLDRRTARIQMRHVHLPKLVDSGAVVTEADGSRVRLTSTGEFVERVRRQIDSLFEDRSESQFEDRSG